MMNDRELLELAAKAARYECRWTPDDPFHLRAMQIAPNWQTWNPLDDDGDALRLAVQAGVDISFAQAVHHEENGGAGYRADPYSFTRRAIVLAAAEIGRAMTT